MTERVLPDRFHIGPWQVQPPLNRLTGPQGLVQMEPRVMRVLVCLAEQAGNVVTREELLTRVWEHTVVNEDSLTRTISDLRKTFGDDRHHPHVIETIRSVGYRLIAPVTFDLVGDTSPITQKASDLTVSLAMPRIQSTSHPRLHRMLWLAWVLVVIVGGVAWTQLRPSAIAPASPLLHRVPTTTLQGVEKAPTFSPDGNQIAFVWTGENNDNEDIYIKLTDSETVLRLTNNPARDQSPAWSPDGRSLAFLRLTEETCTVFVIPALGGTERKIADCAATPGSTLAWSPDGNWLALPLEPATEPTLAIFLLSPETGVLKQATFPEDAADLYPAFSHDGSHLSFARFTGDRVNDLYVVPTAGGAPTRLTHDNRFILGHAWTPDDRRLVFSSNRSGNRKLWHVSVSGGPVDWLNTLDTYDPTAPTFSPQHHHMAYVEWFLDFNIWQRSLEPNTQEPASRVIGSTRWDRHPSLSPDGQRIAFTSNRSGSNELWVADRAGTQPVRLTTFDNAYVSTPRWSPDSKHLLFEASLEGQADIYRIATEGGPPQRITSESSDEWAPYWSNDGAWIYFGSNRSGTWQIWKQSIEDVQLTQVTQTGGFAAQESPDGRTLYYTKPATPGIWQQTLGSTDETQIVSSLRLYDWGNWAVTAQGIYFIDRSSSDGPHLMFYHFEQATETKITPLPSTIPMGSAAMSFSADGTTILYTQNDRQESDIMYVDAFQ